MTRLREIALQAAAVHDGAARIEQRQFLRDCGFPRTKLAPTPIFINRSGYREAYSTLLDIERAVGPMVFGEELRLKHKRLSTLYEYWCFIQVIALLRARLGPPEPGDAFTMIDDIYRPELASGQQFRFTVTGGRGDRADLIATYEPEFVPAGWRGSHTSPFRSALASAPLRPDVTLEIRQEGRPGTIAILDAKSRSRIESDILWEPTDYRALIFDPADGHQPVRQVFLLHRDLDAAPLSNLPGYLEGRMGDRGSSIIGAVPFMPNHTGHVERVLDRFLDVQIGRD